LRRLLILPAARNDLIDIGDYIATDNPTRARTFIDELERQMRTCAERPFSFPSRDDLLLGIRAAKYGRYLIFFEVDDNEVRIVHVRHAMRNLKALFEVRE
jgi:toxin ParE1/3/4